METRRIQEFETSNPAIFRDVLKAALCPESVRKRGSQGDLVSVFAADLSVNKGEIRSKNKKIRDITACYRKIRNDWEEGRGIKKDEKRSTEAFVAIRHILGHLPRGQGAEVGALENSLAALGRSTIWVRLTEHWVRSPWKPTQPRQLLILRRVSIFFRTAKPKTIWLYPTPAWAVSINSKGTQNRPASI